MLVLPVLLVALPVLLVALFLQYRWTNRHILAAASKLRCPPALPLIGNALYFLGDITTVTNNIARFANQFKGLFCIWIGPVPLFVASNPADVQVVLNSSNTLEKDETYDFLKPFMGNGLLTGPVHHWKKQRRYFIPVMHPNNVGTFLSCFNEVGKELADRLSVQSADGELDPRYGIFAAALDAVTGTILARSRRLSKQAQHDIHDLLDSVGRMFTHRLFKIWLHIDWVFNFIFRKEMDVAFKQLASLHNVFEEYWKEVGVGGEEDVGRRPDCSCHTVNIIEIAKKDIEEGGNKRDWFDEVSTIIVGATDTVVAAISFLLLTLGNHPEIQDKVYAEIQEVMGPSDRDVTMDDVNRMTYLGQALMETMRLHGVFPVILRKVTKDTKLSECTLPPGSRVMVTLHAMGWNPDVFPEPEKFIPERFSPDAQAEKKKPSYTFLPFSAGPRNCIGKPYAMAMMKTVLVHILRRFRVRTNVKLEDIVYELKVVMFSKNPLMMQFEPLHS